MFSLFKRKELLTLSKLPPVKIPLTNIKEINQEGIRYIDNEGALANIKYGNAYKGWCRSKGIRKSTPKYICDRTRTKTNERQLIFYTNPHVIFYVECINEKRWIDNLNKIVLYGYATFDME